MQHDKVVDLKGFQRYIANFDHFHLYKPGINMKISLLIEQRAKHFFNPLKKKDSKQVNIITIERNVEKIQNTNYESFRLS